MKKKILIIIDTLVILLLLILQRLNIIGNIKSNSYLLLLIPFFAIQAYLVYKDNKAKK